jgi:tetratricopeptide (TPR) repeat protein
MWSASYDSEPSSLFAFQRELSTAIAEQIRLRRSLERLTALAGRQTQDFSAAAQFAQQAISIDPEFWVGYFQLAQAHEQLGNTDLAFDALNNAGRFSGGNSKPTALRGYLFAKLGKSKEAHDVLNTLEAVSRERYIRPTPPRWFTRASANGMRPATGLSVPMTRGTSISWSSPSVQSGIIFGPIPSSRLSSHAARSRNGIPEAPPHQ